MQRVGIVGVGFGAKVHFPAFQSIEGVQVAALADGGSGRAKVLAASMGVPHGYSDWREIIDAQDVDIVSVVTPPSAQAEIVIAALEAGKHVICEKPFGRNLSEATAMWQAANRSEQFHAVDFEFRMEPGIGAVRRQAVSGAIGRILHVDVSWLTGGRADPTVPWSWQHDAEAGGGVLESFGSHAIDYVEWICQTSIVSVIAQSAIVVATRRDSSGALRAVTSEDSSGLLCKLANGATASFRFSNCFPFSPGHRIEILGQQGRLIFTQQSPFTPEKVDAWLESEERGLRPIKFERLSTKGILDMREPAFRQLAVKFVALTSGRPSEGLPDFASGLRARTVLDAAHRSLETRKEVTLLEGEFATAPLTN